MNAISVRSCEDVATTPDVLIPSDHPIRNVVPSLINDFVL